MNRHSDLLDRIEDLCEKGQALQVKYDTLVEQYDTLLEERDTLKAELDNTRAVILDDTHTETEIEKLCTTVLGQPFVDGDSMCVPGPLGCVEELVKRFEKERAKHRKTTAILESLTHISRCAGCGENKPLPYRRGDLGGYVCLTCVQAYLDRTLAELETERKRGEAMREALTICRDQLIRVRDKHMYMLLVEEGIEEAGSALSNTAGSDYVPRAELDNLRERVKPLVKALHKMIFCYPLPPGYKSDDSESLASILQDALTAAHALGLTEEGKP